LRFSVRSESSVQKEAGLGVLNHPSQTLLEILACHGTAPQNVPPMRSDLIQSQALVGVKSVLIENEFDDNN
jgi:hypothetical protein